jgi:hypothetical protein
MTFAIFRSFFPTASWPGPGLVKIDAGMPGQPLH